MRIVAFVIAGLLGLLSVGLLGAGGLLLWGDSRTDEHGFLSTTTERFATTTYAMSTDNLEVDLDAAGWIIDRDRFGKIRLTVDSSRPVFAGIAPTATSSATCAAARTSSSATSTTRPSAPATAASTATAGPPSPPRGASGPCPHTARALKR